MRLIILVLAVTLVTAGCAAEGPVAAELNWACEDTLCATPLVTAGEVALAMSPTSPGSVAFDRAQLVSSDPEVLDVAVYQPAGDVASADLVAGVRGSAVLSLLDAGGEVIDEVAIEVKAPDRVAIAAIPVAGASPYSIDHVDGIGPHFTFEIATLVEVTTSLYAGADPLTGRLSHRIEIDESAVPPDQWLEPYDEAAIAAGRFRVRITPGDHDVTIEAVGAATFGRVRLTGR